MGKNFDIFSIRRFKRILFPAYCGIVAQLAAKMNKENLESAFIAFLLKKRKGGMDSSHDAEKSAHNVVFPCGHNSAYLQT